MPSSPTAANHPANAPRILYWGSPSFAVPALQALVDAGYHPVAVVTQPDRVVGRSSAPAPTPVKQAALALGIPVLSPESIREESFLKVLKDLSPDLSIVCAYGKILPQSILDLPSKGSLNIHASLLPKLRGASPIHHAILEGFNETGVTLMRMDAELDHGPMLSKATLPLDGKETLPLLSSQLADLGATLLVQDLPAFLQGKLPEEAQDDRQATKAPLLTKASGHIDWTKSATHIERMIRAFTPWPGVWTSWHGQRLKVLAGDVSSKPFTGKPGTVVRDGNLVAVVCGEGALELFSLQMENRPPQSIQDFLHGYQEFVGVTLG